MFCHFLDHTCLFGLPPLHDNVTVFHTHYGHGFGPCYGRLKIEPETIETCDLDVVIEDFEIVTEGGVQYMITLFKLTLPAGSPLERELVFSRDIFMEQIDVRKTCSLEPCSIKK